MHNHPLAAHCSFCGCPLQATAAAAPSPITSPAPPVSPAQQPPNDWTSLSAGPAPADAAYGPYQLEQQAGSGGMGVVYRAYDATLQRQVALKVLHPQVSDGKAPDAALAQTQGASTDAACHTLSRHLAPSSQQLLLTEARLASALQHPNIVTVYDISRHQGQPYIVTEWLDARPLDAFDDAPLPVKLDLLAQLAEGLCAAHQAGVIHGDLKPANVLVCQDLRLKIVDFGMASRRRQQDDHEALPAGAKTPPALPPVLASQLTTRWSSQTTAAQLKGTLPYLAPELLQTNCALSVQTDAFAFGVLLYQLLYGVPPFLRSDANSTIQAILQQQRQAPAQPVKLPAAVLQLIERCLSAQPTARPADFASVASLLRKKQHTALQQQKLGRWYWASRWQSWLALAPLLMLMLLWLGQQSIDKARLLTQGQTLAILPFDNLGADPSVDQFLQGMALSLSQDLATIGLHNGQVWVVPPAELSRLKTLDREQVYQQYHTDLIVSGALQHLGASRRLTLTLQHGADGRLLGSTELDLPLNGWRDAQQQVRSALLQLLDWQQPQGLALSQGVATSDEAYQAYLTGLSLLYRFDYKDNVESGIKTLEQAVTLAPDFNDAKFELVSGYLRAARIKGVTYWLPKAEGLVNSLKTDPSAKLSALKAEIAKLNTNYLASEQHYLKALELDPKNAEVMFGLGGIYQTLGKNKQAENYLTAAATLSPNWHYKNRLALFHYRHAQYAEAIYVLRQILIQFPNNAEIMQTLGAVHLAEGAVEDAVVIFRRALEIEQNAVNLSNLATGLFYLNKFDEALGFFKKAVSKDPNNSQVLGNMADSYRLLGKHDLAKPIYEKALLLTDVRAAQQPNNPKYQTRKALYLASLGRCTDAEALVDLLNDETQTLVTYGKIYKLCLKNDLAIEKIRLAINFGYRKKAIELEPDLRALLQYIN